MSSYKLIAIICFLGLTNCTSSNSAEEAAKEFCECMKENGSDKDYIRAYDVCDAQLVRDFYYYRYFNVEMNSHNNEKDDYDIRKKAMKFDSDFTAYVTKYCCKEMYTCNLISDHFYIYMHKDIFFEEIYPLKMDSLSNRR